MMKRHWREYYPSKLPPKRDVSIEELIKEERKNILPSPYFYVLYDHELSELLYISPKVKDIYGFSQTQINDHNEHLLFEITLEDEKPVVLRLIKKIWDEYYQLGKHYISGHIFNLEYHVRSLNGQVLHIMHQNEVFTFTEADLPKTVIARFVDISWLFPEEKDRVVKLYVYNRKTNGVEHYWEEKINKSSVFQLTPREKEIQELLNHGFTSKEIAHKLNISVETIKTHRKNIKAKLSDA